ncbi:hypothetical protein, partial [Burkholderia sp. BCC0405]|uniref:hypothetical protein n=1 Tax=Burkholderia sp. BCC0405 TaxID=2676298 RepID=UPI001ABBA066
ALRFQQQRSEIMNRVSQLVNNFLTSALRLRGSTSGPVARARLPHTTNPASLFRAAFPLARKRRDCRQLAAFMQGV